MRLRQSIRDRLEHRHDNIKYLGYEYRGSILRRSLSSLLYLDKKRELILDEMDFFLGEVVDTIKHIKKAVNFTYSRNDRNLN